YERGTVPPREGILVGEYAAGEVIEVEMHDGSFIKLKSVDKDHDPRNRESAIRVLEKATMEQQFLTGLLYYEEPRATLEDTLGLHETPLVHLPQDKLRPSKAALENVMKGFM